MFFSKKPCCDTFNCLYHILWRYHWYSLKEKMHMVQIYSNLMKYNLIGLFLNLMQTYLSNTHIKDFMLEYLPSVLYRTYEMKQKQVLIMSFDNMSSFHKKNSYSLTRITIQRKQKNRNYGNAPQQADGENC